jgi:thiamine transport system substrate-binding protein
MRLFRSPLVVVLALAACSKKSEPVAEIPKSFRVLTYSSMTGEGSLGALAETAFEKRCFAKNDPSLACDLVFVPEDGDSSIVASYLKNPESFQAVLGLESLQVEQLRAKTALGKTALFARGPHAFIVDTLQWKDRDRWPKSWKELSKFPKSVFVQDPRVSSVGIGWIKAIFSHHLIDEATAKKITKKVFPSWSLSYSAFQRGGAPLVWSYQSSEAYHLCEEKGERYKVLPLEEGYPVQEEFVVIPSTTPSLEASLFVDLVLSDEIQTQIPLKNWMWPASDKMTVPECFAKVTKIKTLENPNATESAAKLRDWMDAWSL